MADLNYPQGATGATGATGGTGATGTDKPKIKVEVRSRNEGGFRRLGRHFTQNPEEIEVTEEEYEQQLRNDGQLIVRRLDGKDQAAGATGTRADTSTAFSAPVGGGHTPGTSTRAEGKPLPSEEENREPARRR